METLIIDSPINGKLIELGEVNDKVFSSGSAGRGVAVKNPDGKIFAPFSGTIEFIAPPGLIGLKSFGGVELLIHVGLDTCKLIGETFKPCVAQGDTIRRGQLLFTFEPQEITRAGFDSTTPVVVTNPENFGDIIFRLGEQKIIAQAPNFKAISTTRSLKNLFGGAQPA